GSGNDLLVGGQSADAITGNDGVDSISYLGSPGGVAVNLQTGAASGGDAAGDSVFGVENLQGSQFGDVLTGSAVPNSLTGLGGDDLLTGGGGPDVLKGGKGNDVANYATSPAAVTVDLSVGSAGGGDAEGDSLTSIEGAIGSAFDDTLVGDGNDNVF